jgi:uncharacterized protein
MPAALRRLRIRAASHTFAASETLERALARLPFVQADPIRSPARAQDLILRQRVAGYRVGDLERAYPELDLEEGYLYAYGFMPRALWQMRHPPQRTRLSALEKKVLARVGELGSAHPEALRAELGKQSSVNAWGGQSTRVKLALEALHGRGLLRVTRREKGTRVYAPCPPLRAALTPSEVFAHVALAVVTVLAPARERGVRSLMARLSRRIPGVKSPVRELEKVIGEGALEREEVDGVSYLSPAAVSRPDGVEPALEDPERVRILAPFDPLVWDRGRFEHLWGWSYRFEAYTPVAKRVRGYYAMPLCRGADVIGWANVDARRAPGTSPNIELSVELGFVGSRPRARDFGRELDAEIERLRAFLVPPAGVASNDDATLLAEHLGPIGLRSRRAPGSSRPRADRRSPRPRS